MNACISVFVAAGVSDCLTDMNCRSCRNPDRVATAMWSAMVSWLSRWMPRLFTTVKNCSTVPFRKVNVCGRFLSNCCRVSSQITCVLSSFSFRRLLPIQARTRSTQHTTYNTSTIAQKQLLLWNCHLGLLPRLRYVPLICLWFIWCTSHILIIFWNTRKLSYRSIVYVLFYICTLTAVE